jgi:hypothetical protein
MKPSSAVASLQQLANLRPPSKMTQVSLSSVMRGLVRSETFTILWLDERCNLWDIYSNHLCPRELGNHFATDYFNTREEKAYEAHWKLMRGVSAPYMEHVLVGGPGARCTWHKTISYDFQHPSSINSGSEVPQPGEKLRHLPYVCTQRCCGASDQRTNPLTSRRAPWRWSRDPSSRYSRTSWKCAHAHRRPQYR